MAIMIINSGVSGTHLRTRRFPFSIEGVRSKEKQTGFFPRSGSSPKLNQGVCGALVFQLVSQTFWKYDE